MRGGVARWKRGLGGSGISSAAAYAFGGACDSGTDESVDATQGTIAAARYAGATVERRVVTDKSIAIDRLTVDELQTWFSGADPATGQHRGRDLQSPSTDLVFDATINAPKSYSLAAVLDPDIAVAYENFQDRLRDRIVQMWLRELNARRGRGGLIREELAQIEVVELRHERSRALDAHKHRHLWLNAKVLGRDGKWSSLDSRVMLRFQNLVNAEGDLAGRTDPEWIAALAAKGYTLDDHGEIKQLSKVVRPLSRRSSQIEANRAARLAQWRASNPGQEPDHTVLTAIDRWAWAHQRPDKPKLVDEDEWTDTVRREIADIDPALLSGPTASPAPINALSIADIDRDDLAAQAVADADSRAAGTGGRFSQFDLRAGVVRAVAASGVVAERSTLTELIEDVTERAVNTGTLSVLDIANVPGHVKHRMATRTASTKIALADAFDQLATPGETVPAQTVSEVASEMLPADRPLDAGQIAAAGAIGGSDRLVTVTGPAGAGKTTMLRVAKSLLDNQGRRMVIVAPTKKAATVAGREVDTESSSLHALLHDWGFRWSDSSNGQVWTRLVPGQVDPDTRRAYDGPHHFALRRGDRIVVDEAGMVDLNAAQALASVAKDANAGIAMVGDHLQALPVGHSGAMSLMRTRSTAAVELCAVHRFKDPAWADLSLRLRNPGDDLDAVAYQIVEDGHAVVVATEADAHRHMADAWMESAGQGKRLAIVTATHEDAQIVNDLVQARRLAADQLDTTSAVGLQNGQVAYIGDVIQTRRNNRNMDVQNRQQWVVQSITTEHDGTPSSITLVSLEDSGVSRVVDDLYLAEHSHLSYASTVHGIQGETTDRSLVGPGVDAAGLYVGLTRGREHNAAVVIGDSNAAAREQLMQAMQRGTIEATLDDSRSAAQRDLAHAARQVQIPMVDGKKHAPWHDKTARPLGDLVNIDHLLTETADQEKSLFEQIARLSDKIAIDQAALNEAQLRLGAWEARKHASEVGGGASAEAPLLMPAIDVLQERTYRMRTERNELAQSYRELTQRMSALHREVSIREQLGNQVSAYEDDARRRQQRHNDVDAVPAWNDQKLRPLGHVAALRVKQLSTAAELARVTADAEQRAAAIAAVQETLRRSKISDHEVIDRAQWERAAQLLPHAQVAYDRVVQQRSELTRLMRTIDVEISIREQLHRESPARSRQEALDRSSQAAKTGAPRLRHHEVDGISAN